MAEAAVDRVLLLGDEAPDFTLESSEGKIQWHEYIKGSWALLFSHPADFTPVCTSELGRVAQLDAEFKKRGVRVAAISVDTIEHHAQWIQDINEINETKVNYPILADTDRTVSRLYGMLSQDHFNAQGLPLTVRSVFLIGPDRKIKLTLTYPASTGRNFDEILRVVDSVQLTAYRKVATPVDWRKGQQCIILPSVKEPEAKELFPGGWKAVKPYLRLVPDPSDEKLAEQVLLKGPELGPAAAALSKGQKGLRLGDEAPDFKAPSTTGEVQWHEFIAGSWAVLFSHPRAMTPVCTTELGRVAQLDEEWKKRGVRVASLSVDRPEENEAWLKDINEVTGGVVKFPVIADPDRKISLQYGMLNQEHLADDGLPFTVRSVFVIAPDKKVRIIINYPASTGRNFDEILRAIDSLQLTAKKSVATPADWRKGQRCVVLPTIPTEKAKELFPKGVTVIRPWLRTVEDPSDPDPAAPASPAAPAAGAAGAAAGAAEVPVVPAVSASG